LHRREGGTREGGIERKYAAQHGTSRREQIKKTWRDDSAGKTENLKADPRSISKKRRREACKKKKITSLMASSPSSPTKKNTVLARLSKKGVGTREMKAGGKGLSKREAAGVW